MNDNLKHPHRANYTPRIVAFIIFSAVVGGNFICEVGVIISKQNGWIGHTFNIPLAIMAFGILCVCYLTLDRG